MDTVEFGSRATKVYSPALTAKIWQWGILAELSLPIFRSGNISRFLRTFPTPYICFMSVPTDFLLLANSKVPPSGTYGVLPSTRKPANTEHLIL